MATKTITVLFPLLLAVCGCLAQKMHIAHAPPYIMLMGQDTTLSSSDLHHVIGAPLGLSDKKNTVLQSKSLLKRPKANVLITVLTDQDLPLHSQAHFNLDWDVPFVNTELMMSSAQRKFQDPLMLDMGSHDGVLELRTSSPSLQSLPSQEALNSRLLDADSVVGALHTTLNHSLPAQRWMLAEMQAMADLVTGLKQQVSTTHRSTPDLLTFTLKGLQAVGAEHGADSTEAEEGSRALTQMLGQMTSDLRAMYRDHVMVEVLTVPPSHHAKSRKARSLMAEADPTSTPKGNNLNLEIDYYPDFPVSFNIVLWLMLILVLVVFFTAYGIWNMNPNLESILYRVPQDEQLKKNN